MTDRVLRRDNLQHQKEAVAGAVRRLKSDAWPIMWGRCPRCSSWTITDGELEWCSFIGGEDIPACSWQDALSLNSQAICIVLREALALSPPASQGIEREKSSPAPVGDGKTAHEALDQLSGHAPAWVKIIRAYLRKLEGSLSRMEEREKELVEGLKELMKAAEIRGGIACLQTCDSPAHKLSCNELDTSLRRARNLLAGEERNYTKSAKLG